MKNLLPALSLVFSKRLLAVSCGRWAIGTISILHAPIQDSSQDFVDSMFFLFSSDDGEEKQLELCARPDWPGGGDEGAGYAFLDPGLI
ncbi:MAG: hypothetical protein WDN67_00115 [Candidatus Moraniibacteriota bacterium]